MYHSTCVEVRGQLWESACSLPCGLQRLNRSVTSAFSHGAISLAYVTFLNIYIHVQKNGVQTWCLCCFSNPGGFVLFVCLFDTESYYVALADLKPAVILLSQAHQCWDYRGVCTTTPGDLSF